MKFPRKITKTNKTVLEQIEKDILTVDYSKQLSIYLSGEIYTFKVDDTIFLLMMFLKGILHNKLLV